MKQLTIAQRRAAQLNKFNADYIHNIETAKRILNSYYRYVALSHRVLELENDSRTYNTTYCREEAAKEEKHYKRLTSYLKPYGITIFVPWITPTLVIKDDARGVITSTVIEPILY